MTRHYYYYRSEIIKNKDRTKREQLMKMAKDDLTKKYLKQNEYDLLLSFTTA